MEDFTITEDFPKTRLSSTNGFQIQMHATSTCSNRNGQMVSSVKNVATPSTGLVLEIFICVPIASTTTH